MGRGHASVTSCRVGSWGVNLPRCWQGSRVPLAPFPAPPYLRSVPFRSCRGRHLCASPGPLFRHDVRHRRHHRFRDLPQSVHRGAAGGHSRRHARRLGGWRRGGAHRGIRLRRTRAAAAAGGRRLRLSPRGVRAPARLPLRLGAPPHHGARRHRRRGRHLLQLHRRAGGISARPRPPGGGRGDSSPHPDQLLRRHLRGRHPECLHRAQAGGHRDGRGGRPPRPRQSGAPA